MTNELKAPKSELEKRSHFRYREDYRHYLETRANLRTPKMPRGMHNEEYRVICQAYEELRTKAQERLRRLRT